MVDWEQGKSKRSRVQLTGKQGKKKEIQGSTDWEAGETERDPGFN